MARTNVKGTQVSDGSITRVDLNTATPGSALITKAVAGTGVSLSSSGADAGTGDVTISADLSYLDGRYPSLASNRSQNSVFAGPSSGSGPATFRNLVAGDIPAIAISGVTGLQTALDAKLSGSGTAGYLPKYTGSLSLGNSVIYESGGDLRINGRVEIGVVNSIAAFNSTLMVDRAMNGNNAIGVLSSGELQSAAAGISFYYATLAATAAGSYTVPNIAHYSAFQLTFGAGSTVTNQYGFYARSSLTGAANNYGFYGDIPAGTNRWNLYNSGTANNYMAGSLGIGTNALTGYNLRVNKTITGATTSYGIANAGAVQSDVTTASYMYHSNFSTQAASFTLASAYHYAAIQGTIGAGSTVTNQIGFLVGSSLTGAANNYGFYGDIPAGTNRWNLYNAGTANNYMAGALGIGTTFLTGYNLRVLKAVTGDVNSISVLADGTIQADVTSTAAYFYARSSTAASSFTVPWMTFYSASQGTFGAGSLMTNQIAYYAAATLTGATNNHGFRGDIPAGTGRFNNYHSGTASNYFNGNVWIGTNAGTYKLDVIGDVNTSTYYRIGGVRVGEWGSFQTSSQYSSFASVANWGATFVNGSATGMPSSATQWHVIKLGLGTDVSTYATYLSFGRPYSTHFNGKLYVRGIYGVDDSGWLEVGKYTGTGAISVNGTTNVISIATANEATTGALSSGDWSMFNSKLSMPGGGSDGQVLVKSGSSLTWGSIPIYSGTGAISVTGTTISIATANEATTGALTGADWYMFYSKISMPAGGSNGQALVKSGTSLTWGTVLTYSGAGAISVSGNTISIATANEATTGALTGADWSMFNNKLSMPGGGFDGQVLVKSGLSVVWGSIPIYSGSGAISVSGTTISIATANEGTTGALANYDWSNFNSKLSMPGGGSDGQVLVKSGSSVVWGSFTTYTGSGAISVSGGTISITTANEATTGALTGADWSMFNNKMNMPASPAEGNILIYALGAPRWASLAIANEATTGVLTGADWTMFNNKFSLPGGGSDGQVLMKSGGSVVWGTVSGGGGGLSDGFTLYLESYIANAFTFHANTDLKFIDGSGNLKTKLEYQSSGDGFSLLAYGSTNMSIGTTNGDLQIGAGGTGKVYIGGVEFDLSGIATGKILKATSYSKLEFVNP